MKHQRADDQETEKKLFDDKEIFTDETKKRANATKLIKHKPNTSDQQAVINVKVHNTRRCYNRDSFSPRQF